MREGRQRRGWTQRQAAKILGVSQKTISTLENTGEAGQVLLKKCAEQYGLDMADILATKIKNSRDGFSETEQALIQAARAKDLRKSLKLLEKIIYEPK
jgi:transcriptional regulator with XRE-family HTH domain